MGKIMNEKLRLCRIEYSGIIPELGCIQGPVRKCRLNSSQIRLLIGNGKRVYELNPENPSEEIKLTVTNCATPQFAKGGAPGVSSEKPKETIPQVPITEESESVPENNVGNSEERNSSEDTGKNKYEKYNKNKKNDYKKNTSEKLTEADIQ